MTNDPRMRTVTIISAKTGEVRQSEPVRDNASRLGVKDLPADVDGTPPAGVALPTAMVSTQRGEVFRTDRPVDKQPKVDIDTLEQFLEYAYTRKNKLQPLNVKSQVEKQLARNARLDDAALRRLLEIARNDSFLVVPRELLLLSRSIEGLPSLRREIVSFVEAVMLQHPVFSDAAIQAAVRNTSDDVPAVEAIAGIAAYAPSTDAETALLKAKELQELRRNAAQLLVTWLAVSRGLNPHELSSLLFQALWQPAARAITDEAGRLRALTAGEQAAGIGLACLPFRQQAGEARAQREHWQRAAAELREKLAASDALRMQAETERDALIGELQALRNASAAEQATLRSEITVQGTHLHHVLEQLRGRLVKRLSEGLDMLEVGLSALRKEPPRVPVMLERAEHVVDTLRTEIQSLQEE
jgi:hypothetical protein